MWDLQSADNMDRYQSHVLNHSDTVTATPLEIKVINNVSLLNIFWTTFKNMFLEISPLGTSLPSKCNVVLSQECFRGIIRKANGQLSGDL